MKFSHLVMLAALTSATPVWAVYAPVPEQEQGKDFTVSLRAGYTYDTNIFGAPDHTLVPQFDATGKQTGVVDIVPISSGVWEVAPRLTYNHSITDQTFFSVSYGLVVDDIENRPGQTVLPSHDLTVRLAHAFNQSSTIDLTDLLMVSRNPASLLTGVPVNTDQSLTRNQLDGRYTVPITAKAGLELKARSVDYQFRDAVLSTILDRVENLYGVAGNYAVLPEFKAVAEVRHLDVNYANDPGAKNKHSEFAMGGFDYSVAKELTLSTRGGAEWRSRAQEPHAVAPFVEVSGQYSYGEQSFITGGYGYSFDEASDPSRFTDQKVNRIFVNVQHAVTALIVASASIDYEPSVLQSTRAYRQTAVQTFGKTNLDETATRAGLALSYLPTKNWVISLNYDVDHTNSDDPARTTKRQRVGVSGSYTF